MKLPLIPIKQPKEWLYFNRVQEIETSRDGENLKTGGWHPYTVKNTYLKNAKKNRRMLKYVAAKASSGTVERSKCHSRTVDGG